MRYLFVLALLAGCGLATVPRDDWTNATKSAEDLPKDRYECDLVASRETVPAYRNDLVRSCLRAKGWREN